MRAKPGKDLRWIKIGGSKYIPEIRANGPVVYPIQLPSAEVLKIVNRGTHVIEVDPVTRKEIVLNLSNIFEADRFGKRETPVAPIPEAHKEKIAPSVTAAAPVEEVAQPVIEVAPQVSISEEEVHLSVEAPVETAEVAADANTNQQNHNKKKNKR